MHLKPLTLLAFFAAMVLIPVWGAGASAPNISALTTGTSKDMSTPSAAFGSTDTIFARARV